MSSSFKGFDCPSSTSSSPERVRSTVGSAKKPTFVLATGGAPVDDEEQEIDEIEKMLISGPPSNRTDTLATTLAAAS